MTQRMNPVVHGDPEILGGTPVFVGTRVPLRNLIDYLEGGQSLDEFLDDFPSVTREQAINAWRGYIYGPKNNGKYYISNGYIYGPRKSGKFYIHNDYIFGPNEDPPWLED